LIDLLCAFNIVCRHEYHLIVSFYCLRDLHSWSVVTGNALQPLVMVASPLSLISR